MALQFCDGFDSYGAAGDLMGNGSSYVYNSGPSDLVYLPAGGRFSGGALRIVNLSAYERKKLPTPVDAVFVNAALFPRGGRRRRRGSSTSRTRLATAPRCA